MAAEILNSRYEIIESLAEQTAPLRVAKARDTQGDGIVLIETLPAESLDGGAGRAEGFRAAVAAAARLSHVGIARVLDQGEEFATGDLFVVTEYGRGITLRERVRRVAPFALSVSADIALGIAEALEYAHGMGVPHGDLRPENVLLSPEGQIKATDWAYGRAAAQAISDAPAARTPYFAPAAAPGALPSEAADLYALGVILFEMLAGTTPLPGQTSPRALHPNIPPALDGIAQKALHSDPFARYQAASALRADLAAVRDALRSGRSLAWSPLDRPAAPPRPLSGPAAPPVGTVVGGMAVGAAAIGGLKAGELKAGELKAGELKAGEKTPGANAGALTAAAQELEFERTIEMQIQTPEKKGRVKKAKAPRPEREPTGLLTIAARVLFVLAVIGLIGLVWWGQKFFAIPSDISVPNLVGKTFDDAQRLAQQQNFSLTEGGSDYSDKWPENQIYAQNPPFGRTIKAGQEISVKRSLGPRLLRVPNLSGMTQERANRELHDANLPVGTTIEDFSESVQKDVVLKQDPEPGKMVARNTAVNFVLSKGAQPPDAPEEVAADPKTTSTIDVSWKAAPRAATYSVQRSLDDGTTQTIAQGITDRRVTDTGLKPDTAYTYTVIAANSAGKSLPSDPAPATTPAPITAPPELGSDVNVVPPDDSGTPTDNSSTEPARMRQFPIEIPLSRRPRGERHVQIEVQDTTGTNLVYDEMQPAGKTIRTPVTAFGNKVTISIFLDGKLVRKTTL